MPVASYLTYQLSGSTNILQPALLPVEQLLTCGNVYFSKKERITSKKIKKIR